MPAAASNEKEHISGDTTPIKNPAITAIDKLISLSPSPMKPHLISPAKQPVVYPVKEIASASVSQVHAYSVTYSWKKGQQKNIGTDTQLLLVIEPP
jgi:hypothetical protein